MLRICGGRWRVSPLTLVFKCVALAAAAWDLVAAAFTAAAAFGAFCGTFTLVNLRIVLVGDFLFAFAGLFPVTQQQAAAAGGHYASEAKATPRVDVGDTPKASRKKVPKHQSSKSLSRTWLERRWLCGVSIGMDEVSLVISQVELLTGVPCSLFYLVGASGRRLREDVTLEQSGIGPDSSLFMTARLVGGSMRQRAPLVPGSWTCNNCNMGGCWPSKNVCFRCLAPHTGKGDATFGQGAASATIWQSHG